MGDAPVVTIEGGRRGVAIGLPLSVLAGLFVIICISHSVGSKKITNYVG
jgi:hypothetical protein